jgi:O-antigen ligase
VPGEPVRGLSSDWRRDITLLGAMAVLALVFYAVPWGFVYVPALIALAVLTWRRLDLALWLVIAFAPAFMAPKHVGTREFPPSEILLGLDVVMAAAYLLVPDKSRRLDLAALRRTPFLLPAGLFLLAATVSTLLAADHAEAFRTWRWVVVEPVLLFGLLLLLESTDQAWITGFVTLVAAGLAVAAIAVGQFATRRDLSSSPGSSLLRAKALYGSPDNLGLFFDRVVPIWFAVLVLVRMRRSWRAAWLAVGGLLCLALLFTFSRGAWLAIVVACLALAAIRARGRWIVAAAVLVGAAVLVYRGPQTIDALRSGHSNTVQRRFYLWQSSARMIRDHPIVGIGPDNFLHYYAPRHQLYLQCNPGLGYMDPRASVEPCLSHPHDEVLDLWLSTGILGLAAFVWLQVVFWRNAIAAFRTLGAQSDSGSGRGQADRDGLSGSPVVDPQTVPTRVVRILVAGTMGAMLAGLIHGLVDNSYFLEDLSLVFWMFCAFISYLVTRVNAA